MIKHATLNLDMELLARAQQELGTRTATDTIHRALEEAVNRARRRRMLEYDFSGLTPEVIDEMRRSRCRCSTICCWLSAHPSPSAL